MSPQNHNNPVVEGKDLEFITKIAVYFAYQGSRLADHVFRLEKNAAAIDGVSGFMAGHTDQTTQQEKNINGQAMPKVDSSGAVASSPTQKGGMIQGGNIPGIGGINAGTPTPKNETSKIASALQTLASIMR